MSRCWNDSLDSSGQSQEPAAARPTAFVRPRIRGVARRLLDRAFAFLRGAFAFSGSRGAALIRFVLDTLTDLAAGDGRRETALRRFFQAARKCAADADPRRDDFIHRKYRFDARHRETRGSQAVSRQKRGSIT